MRYDHAKLADTNHMLEWLHPTPVTEIERIFADYVNEMVPGSQLLSLSIESDPQWLTGAKPQFDDPDKAILTRTGVAFLFSFDVQAPNRPQEQVRGVFSWVAAQLDDPPNTKQRTWIDVGGTLEEFGSKGKLRERIYTLEAKN